MAAATTTAGGVPNCVLEPVQGSSLQNAFLQINPSNPQNLDILQITVPGSNSIDAVSVALNVDFAGVVHNPAVSPTKGTRAGTFHAIDQTSGASTAALFASVWKWNATSGAKADILQVVSPNGGNISYWLDFLGVAHGS
jgi:hypothetical protein